MSIDLDIYLADFEVTDKGNKEFRRYKVHPDLEPQTVWFKATKVLELKELQMPHCENIKSKTVRNFVG